MEAAIYDALYIEHSAFQWIHFTPYGIVAGRVSKDLWYLDDNKKVRKELLEHVTR